MTVPSLPIDNLYKFMTTLGILLCAFSMWSWMTLSEKADDTLANIEATNDAADVRVRVFDKRIDLLQRRANTATSDVAELQRRVDEPNTNPAELERRVNAMNSVAADMSKELKDMRAEGEAILAEWQKNLKDSQIGIAKVKSGMASASQFRIGYWTGLIVAFAGGILWYWNFQVIRMPL
jgi:hypothetical protein